MSGVINSGVSGDEKLAKLQKAGKFLHYGPYSTCSAAVQYQMDQDYDEIMRLEGIPPILGKAVAPEAPAPESDLTKDDESEDGEE